jgi:hypothetical protein
MPKALAAKEAGADLVGRRVVSVVWLNGEPGLEVGRVVAATARTMEIETADGCYRTDRRWLDSVWFYDWSAAVAMEMSRTSSRFSDIFITPQDKRIPIGKFVAEITKLIRLTRKLEKHTGRRLGG